MTAVIVIVVFFAVSVLTVFCFIAGWKTGRAKIERELAEEAAQKERDKKFYENEKVKIKKGVFENADNKKKKMSNNSGRDKFNAVNELLRNKD